MSAPTAGGSAPLARGACVVSIDTELAWGEAHRRDGTEGRPPLRRRARGHRPPARRCSPATTWPATWAVVGHLFLDALRRRRPRTPPRPGHARLRLARRATGWPSTPAPTLADDPYWYGRDIVDAILACPVPQEVGSHSFSHVIVDDPACTPEVFDVRAGAPPASWRPSGTSTCARSCSPATRSPRWLGSPTTASAATAAVGPRRRSPAGRAGSGGPWAWPTRSRPLAGSAVLPAARRRRRVERAADLPVRPDRGVAAARRPVGAPPDRPPAPGGPAPVAVPPLVPPLQRHGRPRPGPRRPRPHLRGGGPPARRRATSTSLTMGDARRPPRRAA